MTIHTCTASNLVVISCLACQRLTMDCGPRQCPVAPPRCIDDAEVSFDCHVVIKYLLVKSSLIDRLHVTSTSNHNWKAGEEGVPRYAER